jgi:hypothetical protein
MGVVVNVLGVVVNVLGVKFIWPATELKDTVAVFLAPWYTSFCSACCEMTAAEEYPYPHTAVCIMCS